MMLLLAIDNLALAYDLRCESCESDVAKNTKLATAHVIATMEKYNPWLPLQPGGSEHTSSNALVVCVESSCTLQARTGNNGASRPCQWLNNQEIVRPTFWTSAGKGSVSNRVHTMSRTFFTGKESQCIAVPLRIFGNLDEPSLSSVNHICI